MILASKIGKNVPLTKVIKNKVLVIDTNGVYIYVSGENSIIKIFDLDKLININYIDELKTIIANWIYR